MATEIEAKFLDIDHDEIRAKLAAAGAELEAPMRLMRRQLFDYPDGRLQHANHGRLRIRDEGSQVTLTYKARGNGKYAQEFETPVSSYEATADILEAIGLTSYTSQESKRETWQLNDVEVVLDIWPWLEPYIEIEGPSEAAIQTEAQQLGLDWATAVFGSVDSAYRLQYPKMTVNESIGLVSELTFDGLMPQWLVDRQ